MKDQACTPLKQQTHRMEIMFVKNRRWLSSAIVVTNIVIVYVIIVIIIIIVVVVSVLWVCQLTHYTLGIIMIQ